jgi:sugar transferase (PEP-CTERM/EpsH1 system associated)
MTAEVPKPDLLFLCHRIPYPPEKGDKIRSYHWLLALTESFRVHLAAFVDDPDDWAHRERLEALCESCLLLPLKPTVGKARSFSGLLTGEALSLPYYRDRKLNRWLGRVWRSKDIRHLVVYSSAMAQYVVGPPFDRARRVIDFVDVDSDKWRQYAKQRRGPMRWVYGREAARLEAFDLKIARLFDISLFVSPAEAHYFRSVLKDGSGRVTHVNMGVDSAFFDPGLDLQSPYAPDVRAIVFTGAMDYWANVDAVTWFAREAWPQIRAEAPDAVFFIVGRRPTPAVKALAGDGVVVTGTVEDIRPYIGHAEAIVAPIRIARGVQSKILEGMSMARPVIVTPKGIEGISADDGQEVLLANDAVGFARQVLRVLAGAAEDLGAAARRRVRRDYDWNASSRRLVALVRGIDPNNGS